MREKRTEAEVMKDAVKGERMPREKFRSARGEADRGGGEGSRVCERAFRVGAPVMHAQPVVKRRDRRARRLGVWDGKEYLSDVDTARADTRTLGVAASNSIQWKSEKWKRKTNILI